jgi:hypothetical protein
MLRSIVFAAVLALVTANGNAADRDSVSTLLPANTAGSAVFNGSTNGNLSGLSSVSKVDVHTLLYPGSTTKVLAHYLPWWGPTPRGVDVHYRSDDPRQAARTFSDMASRGVDGVIVDWYGAGHFVDTAWKASMPQLAAFPNMSFALMMDSGTFKFNACEGCDLNRTILHHLDYMSREYFSSRQYLRHEGRPVVFEFGMEAVGRADWARIQAAHPEVLWIHIHAHGLNAPASAGAFVWVEAQSKARFKGTTADLTGLNVFYNTATAQPSKIAVGGVWKGFDDSIAPWAAASPNVLPQACGKTWLDGFRILNEHYSAHHQLPYLQLVTWNDYEEGSALETGIASCTKIEARRTGQTLSVSVSYQETVDHLELYEQLGPASFRLVGRYPADTTSIAIATPSKNSFFVKAVGKPFMQDIVSAAIAPG